MNNSLMLGLVLAATVSSAANAADPEAGAALFKQTCQACHVIAPGQAPTLAPNLWGVVGRRAGSTGFAGESPQLKQYAKVWTNELLDRWLTSPAGLVPGARMPIAVKDTKQRANIIAYLDKLASHSR